MKFAPTLFDWVMLLIAFALIAGMAWFLTYPDQLWLTDEDEHDGEH